MPDEARLLGAFALALTAAYIATPRAIAVASRTDFHDRPVGYKGHGRPTPYLGGAAVLAGLLLAAPTLGSGFARLSPLLICAFALWALGTLDDRLNLSPWLRLAAEAVAAMALWAAGLGWEVFGSDALNLATSVVWTVGLVNAFNLMDNMDGVAASVAGVSGIAVGILAVLDGDPALAALCFGLAGACAGFLPYNLAVPSRIFLGDGGSLPIGFVVAGSLMALPDGETSGVARLLVAVLLAGLPVLDTCLVMISRRRAGVPLLTGGRDHLTHRLYTRLPTARTVALTLAAAQAVLGAVAIGVSEAGRDSVVAAWTVWFVAGAATIVLLETRAWAPARPSPADAGQASVGRPDRPRNLPSVVEAALIVFLSVACGLSPFLYGFYDLSVWGPIALMMLASLLGLVVARPALPGRTALVALVGIVAFWAWALLSTTWAESADQALVEANRWMLYATAFAILVLLLRNDRLCRLVLGAATAAILALGLYLVAEMLAGDGASLFLGGRLNEPLGYVNGQAGYLLLGLWPLLAAAERVERWYFAGPAMAGATLLAGLVVLAQTRAVVPAVLVSALVVLLVVPGRARRLGALLVVIAAVVACLGPLLDVYDGGGANPPDDRVRTAALALVAAAAGAGVVWALAGALVARLKPSLGESGIPGRPLAAVPFALLAVGAVLAYVAVDDPAGRVEREYRSFVELRPSEAGSSRFSSGAGNRYDYWRVAAKQFRDNRVRGVGAGNYDRDYFRERRTTEDIKQPHSIELQALGELGLVGAAALGLFLVAVLAGFWRRARLRPAAGGDPVMAVAAGGMFVVWLVHTSVDWLHVIPGVTGLALCAAAALVGPWRRDSAAPRSGARWAVVAACALVVVFGAVLVGRSALAERYRAEGQEALAKEPEQARKKARDSLELNEESLRAYYLLAASEARLGRYEEARAVLLEATRREPHDFVPWALLGDLAARRGDRKLASAYYRRASRLNPRATDLSANAKDPPKP